MLPEDKQREIELAYQQLEEANYQERLKAMDDVAEAEQADLDKMAVEADAALRARRAAYRLTDLSGDDTSLDSRHH